MRLGKHETQARLGGIGFQPVNPMQSQAGRLCHRSIQTLFLRFSSLLFVVLLFPASFCFSQEIILRDLTRIQGVAVEKVSDEFLSLTDGQKLSWDRVLQGRVDPVWQKPFNECIEKFGLPLYRLKHRLKQQNVAGAFDIATKWYDSDAQSFVGDEANFLVSRAVMLGRIKRGDRLGAVEPMIRAIELQQKCSQAFLDSFSEIVFGNDALKTAIIDELLPVWASTEETRATLDKLEESFELSALVNRWPGLAVYLSSMAVNINQRQRMSTWNSAMGSVPQLRQWQRVLGTNLSRAPLSRSIDGAEGAFRVTTIFWWATAAEQQASKRQRVLALLKIVANYADQFPILAKDALAQAIELTDDPDEKAAIEKALGN